MTVTRVLGTGRTLVFGTADGGVWEWPWPLEAPLPSAGDRILMTVEGCDCAALDGDRLSEHELMVVRRVFNFPEDGSGAISIDIQLTNGDDWCGPPSYYQ